MKMTETSLRPVARTASASSDGVPSSSGIRTSPRSDSAKGQSLAARAPADNRVGMDTTQHDERSPEDRRPEDRRLEDRLAALEARVQMLEDQLAVQQLLNRWGPAVDTGDSAAAAALWTEDGV